MQRPNLAKQLWPLLFFAAACATYLYGLGSVPLVGADEPRYAQVAREMYERRDFVTPTLAGLTWIEKPALLYWLMMAAYGLFAVSEFSARLGPACAGLLCVLAGWLLLRKVETESGEESRGLSLTCASVLASSAGLLVFSRGASFDVLLTATVTAALSFFLSSELEGDERRRGMLLAGLYVCVGLSLLAKGLVGIILPLGIVAFYFLLRRSWPGITRQGMWWGVPLALGVAAIWYAPVIARHGWQFVDEFFIQHHFARYVSNRYQHPQPFYFFFGVMPLLALPWTFFLADALRDAWRTGLKGDTPQDKLRALGLAWLIVPVVFFSLSGSKLPGYVLPALPGAAILAGERVHFYLRGRGGMRLMRATGLIALGLGLTGIVFARVSGALPLANAVAISLPSIVAGLAAISWSRRRELCVGALVAGAFLTIILIVCLAWGNFARRESVHELLSVANARGFWQIPVVQLHGIERTVEFYGAGRLAYAPNGQPRKLEGAFEALEFAREAGGRALVLTPLEFAGQLENVPGGKTEVVGDNGAYVLVYLEAEP